MRKLTFSNNFTSKLGEQAKEIYATIPKLTTEEGRRIHGPVYDAILSELYQGDYKLTARHTECILLKEKTLVSQNAVYRMLKDDPQFLFQVIDYLKLAENISKSTKCGALKQCYQILLEVMVLLESIDPKIDWVIADAYKIMLKQAKKAINKDLSASEEIARLHIKCAIYFEDKAHEYQKAIKYFEDALEIVLGQLWSADYFSAKEKFSFVNSLIETLHDIVAIRLFHLYVRQAKSELHFDVKKSADITRKAISIIIQAGVERHPILYCRGHFILAELFLENFEFNKATKVLNNVKNIIMSRDDISFLEIRAELYILEGICHHNLQNLNLAKECFEESLRLSTEYEWKNLEAHVHFNLGKLYSKMQSHNQARYKFELASKIYDQAGDWLNSKKAIYYWAKLMADKRFPLLMILVKDSDENCCSMYSLRKWKNRCQPFWKNMNLYLEKENKEKDAECLVAEYMQNSEKRRQSSLAKWKKIKLYIRSLRSL